jgi:Flp pilus assembly protein TadD
MDLRRYAEAREMLTPILGIPTSSVQAWCMVGACELQLNEPTRGLHAAEYALTLNPDSEWAHRVRSKALARLGRRRESIEAAQASVQASPGSSYGYACLAEAYSENNQTALARQAIEEAIRLAPLEAAHHFMDGLLSQRTGRFDAAEASYRRVLELAPDHASARNNLGVVALRQGRSVEATGHFLGSAQSDPTSRLAARNIVVGARAFLVKLSRLTVGALAVSVILWLLAQSSVGGGWLDFVRWVVAAASVVTVLWIARHGARALPSGLARQISRSPRLASLLVVIVGGLIGCVYFASAPALSSVHSVPALTVLRLLGIANLAVFIANARTGSRR